MQEKEKPSVSDLLLRWYGNNKRDLPWRQEPTPYHVWISEIMLQQTRVEAVKPYYKRFIEELPDVRALAQVEEERLMKLWEGLGYYSRAKNLQKAAKQIVQEFDAKLPEDYQKLLTLPGVGPYTAGAIASIAFGLPEVAVDGNVLRVFARLKAYPGDILQNESKKAITTWVQELLPVDYPGDFNQGLMELGATVCLPNTMPRCEICPLSKVCISHQSGRELCFPVRNPKKQRAVEMKNVFFIVCDHQVLLSKRNDTGLLAGLWELPNEPKKDDNAVFSLLVDLGIKNGDVDFMGKAKHIFTHKQWQMDGYYVKAQPPATLPENYCFVELAKVAEEYALPSAFRDIYAKGLLRMQWNQKERRQSNDN